MPAVDSLAKRLEQSDKKRGVMSKNKKLSIRSMSGRSSHSTEKFRTGCPSSARIDQTGSSSSQHSESPPHWDFENCIMPESINCERRLRSSSWDDSDGESSPEPQNYNSERLQLTKGSVSEELNELKKQFFEQMKNWEPESSDRRQSPARVRRRTKSSSSSSPVSETKSPKKEIPDDSPKNSRMDPQFYLNSFFAKRISQNEPEVEGQENEVSYNNTSRKLSQILEVEENKKDFDENVSLFSRNFRELVGNSPISTDRSRKSEKLPEPKQDKYKSLSFEEFGNFIKLQQLPGSLSERYNAKLDPHALDFISLSAKAGKTHLSDLNNGRTTRTESSRGNRSGKSSPRFPLSIEKDSARSLKLEEMSSPDSVGKNLELNDLKSSSEDSITRTVSSKSELKTERKLPIAIQSPSLKSVELSLKEQSFRNGRMSRRSKIQKENSYEKISLPNEVVCSDRRSEKPHNSSFRSDISMKSARIETVGSTNRKISNSESTTPKTEEKEKKTSRPESRKSSNRSIKPSLSDRSKTSKSSSISRSKDSLEESDDNGKLKITWKELELNQESISPGWNPETPKTETTERPRSRNSKKSESPHLVEETEKENGELLSIINEMSLESIHSGGRGTPNSGKSRIRGSARGSGSDSGKWNELIEKFCGNSNSMKFETNFPGFPVPVPVESSWESKKSFQLGEEDDNEKMEVSKSEKTHMIKKEMEEEEENISQLNSVSKEKLVEKIVKEKEMVNQKLFYFHVNFPTGEGGDVSCWNFGKSDAPDSNRPKDHGDGNRSEGKIPEFPEKKKEKKSKRLLWTEANSKFLENPIAKEEGKTNSEGSEFEYETTPRLSRSCSDLRRVEVYEGKARNSKEREEISENWLSVAENLEKKKKKGKELGDRKSRTSIPQLKLKNSRISCFQNFYKRFIGVFCLTSNSSASSSK